jgi:hypothetical protein
VAAAAAAAAAPEAAAAVVDVVAVQTLGMRGWELYRLVWFQTASSLLRHVHTDHV